MIPFGYEKLADRYLMDDPNCLTANTVLLDLAGRAMHSNTKQTI